MVNVTILGPFRATLDVDEGADDITPSSARERTALAALAVSAPETMSIQALATELYGDDTIADPKNAVQAVVSRLRKLLGSDSIETTANGYRLRAAVSDVDEMTRHRSEGRLAAALATWSGPTLTDVVPGPLLGAERLRLDEVRAELTEASLAARADVDPSATIADIEAAVAVEPLRERRWELLMRTLYRSGRQADALRAYQRARTHLAAELGLEPGPALTELEQQILRQDNSLASALPSRPATVERTLPTGIVTILLCDVEGSVRRWETRPTDTADQIDAMHATWSQAVEGHDGVVVKSTGDGILAVFEMASDAVRAAAAGQAAQRTTDLSIRVALHTGEVISIDDDVRGPTVNRAARLMDLAHGGQILVSGVTADLASGGMDEDLGLRSLGSHWLRDVPEPVEIHQLTGPGLRSSFEPLRSAGPSQLPRLRTALLGRETVLQELTELVGNEPLVTLVGTGGIGKTTLSLAVGWEIADTRSVTFVDLASVRDPSLVAVRIAETLVGNEPNSQRSPVERITDRLGANPDLLVIDNAEHVLDSVAAAVDEILSIELKGSLLVTSRQALSVVGERVVTLSPLPLPDADDDLAETSRNASVQLFLDRMRSTKPDAQLPQGLLPVVAHICRRLDGIPLAIELAAGRTGLLAVEDIASRLDDQLRLLRQVPATRQARHASLEAVAHWSLDQLAPETRRLFGVLSVMAGAFDVNGAEAMAGGAGIDPLDVLDGVSEMVAASLLAAEPDGRRFRMLEPIRQLALAELRAAGGETPTRRAHAAWVTDRTVAAFAAQDETRTVLYRSFDTDADQLLTALRWSLDRFDDTDTNDEDIERTGVLALTSAFWFLEKDPGTGTELIDQIKERIDRDRHPMAWARTTIARATVGATLPVAGMTDDAADAVRIFDEHDDPHRGLARLGAIFTHFATQGNEAFDLLAEADELLSSDDRWNRAIFDLVAMMIRAVGSDEQAPSPEQAIGHGERAVTSLRTLGDRWALGATLGELGRLQRLTGDYAGAASRYYESIELFGDLHYHGLHYILSELGQLASLQGDHAEAGRLHERAIEMADDDGNASCRAQAMLASARSALLAGDEEEAAERTAIARELHPDWHLLSFGLEELDARLDELKGLAGPQAD